MTLLVATLLLAADPAAYVPDVRPLAVEHFDSPATHALHLDLVEAIHVKQKEMLKIWRFLILR